MRGRQVSGLHHINLSDILSCMFRRTRKVTSHLIVLRSLSRWQKCAAKGGGRGWRVKFNKAEIVLALGAVCGWASHRAVASFGGRVIRVGVKRLMHEWEVRLVGMRQ
jgi:hypothetical protein